MNALAPSIFDVIVGLIKQTIAEDWIEEMEITPDTRFNQDLELESIEFVKVADALNKYFGSQVDMQSWLSGKSIHELIRLSVGDLVEFITTALAEAG